MSRALLLLGALVLLAGCQPKEDAAALESAQTQAKGAPGANTPALTPQVVDSSKMHADKEGK